MTSSTGTTPDALPAEPLVNAAWLAARLGTPGLKVLDVRQVPAARFAAGHIPGAVAADYAAAGWRVPVDGVPSQLPPRPQAEALIGGLGIGNGDHVVVVAEGADAGDFANATRVYWTFKVLGHDAVSVLDGGWRAWTADAANPVETGAADPAPARFTARPRPEVLATLPDVEAALAAGVLLVDARAPGQYRGESKSPAARVAGTLPGALNLPPDLFYVGGRTVTGPGLAAILENAGVTGRPDPVVFCNTGHNASLVWFSASELAGLPGVRLYDGSMAEWTRDPARPVENAPA